MAVVPLTVRRRSVSCIGKVQNQVVGIDGWLRYKERTRTRRWQNRSRT
jgi:hypothetical protein